MTHGRTFEHLKMKYKPPGCCLTLSRFSGYALSADDRIDASMASLVSICMFSSDLISNPRLKNLNSSIQHCWNEKSINSEQLGVAIEY